MSNNGVLWTLPFSGSNVEIGATALSDGTLYRLIRSDDFTGVQAVDTTTGSEKWRSAEEWGGTGIGADQTGVYFPTLRGVAALDPATGEQTWDITTTIAPHSLTVNDARIYLWDGQRTMQAIDTQDGSTAWQGVADIDTTTTSARASQPPVASELGIAAVSGTGNVALFDTAGNATGVLQQFVADTVALDLAPDGTVIVAGQSPWANTADAEPWMRKLVAVDPQQGATRWETEYNALVTGLTVTDTMALVLADNGGLAISEVQLVDPEGTATTKKTNPYPEQTSPYISGYFLDTGMPFQEPEDPTAWNATGKTWIADPGNPPFVALAQGSNGPVAISESGQLTFFTTENSLVQAMVDLPGALPDQIAADPTALYVSQDNGTVVALAPEFAGFEQQTYSDSRIDWSMPIDGQLVDFGGMAYSNGLVYRLIDTGSGPQIEATYAATGQPAWTLPFAWSTDQLVADPGPDQHDPAQTWTGSGNIFAVDAENQMIAIDGATGTLAWQHAFAYPVAALVYDADTLYIWDESGTMTALLPQDGTLLWSTASGASGASAGTQSNELGMPIPALTRTVVAMVDANGTLHGFDKELGTLLWSTPGFDGTNTRLVRQGDAAWDQTEIFVVVSATGPQRDDGGFDIVVSGVLAKSGERRWDSSLQGPLVQPVNTDETLVVVTGDQLLTGKNVPTDGTPIVDGESYNHYDWTSTGEPAPEGGGNRLFALDAESGQIVWIRTTASGGFTDLSTKFPTGSGTLYAVTSDGLLISPSRGNGALDGEPAALGGPVLAIAPSGETGAIGSFATLADGTLVAFGGTPFSQQG